MIFSQSGEETFDTPPEIDEESILKYSISSQKQIPKKKASLRTYSVSGYRLPLPKNRPAIFITLLLVVSAVMVYFLFGRAISANDKYWSTLLAQEKAKSEGELREKEEKAQIVTNKAQELQRVVENLKLQLAGQVEQAKNAKAKCQPARKGIITTAGGAKGAPPEVDNPGSVIDVPYDEKETFPLPVDFLRKDSNGKGIADVLYSNDDLRNKREAFQKQRISFIDSKPNFPQLYLAKYNNAFDEKHVQLGLQVNLKEWQRLQEKWKLSELKTQLAMCVVVPGYNNNANFRIEYNLNSIFSQNYTNYKAVIVNDASTDGGGELYRKYFAFHRIDKQHYVYVENSRRITALQNIYLASMNHCPSDSVVVTIDADDEFIGRNVLQVFNWAYQTKKAGVAYSNFFWYQQPSTLMYGFTSEYSEHEKKNNLYRGLPMKFSQLRSYRTELIYQINPKDLQDESGKFFTIAYDMALFFPLMELACGRVTKIEGEFHYLYNMGTGLNDYNDRQRQVAVDNKVRGQKKYECLKSFDERMNK